MLCRVLAAAILLGCLCAPAFATMYNVVAVGTLPTGTSSTATSVDNSGEVAGYTTFSGGSTEAFIWTQSGGLVGLGGTNTEAFGVNNGNVVGIDHSQPFRWTSGSGLVSLDSGHPGQANGVDASGEVIGTRTSGETNRVLTWSASNTISSPFPSIVMTGNAVNNSGQYAGLFTTNQGYYNDGVDSTLVLLGTLIPNSLSNNQIAAGSAGGIAKYENINTLSTTTIGTLLGDTTSNALGINPLGTEIVGLSTGTGQSGFVYTISTSSLQSLNSLLAPASSGWTISSATAVNDSGDISAIGVFGGVQEAVLLTPVVATPEPSTLILLAIGGMALWAFKRRRSV